MIQKCDFSQGEKTKNLAYSILTYYYYFYYYSTSYLKEEKGGPGAQDEVESLADEENGEDRRWKCKLVDCSEKINKHLMLLSVTKK